MTITMMSLYPIQWRVYSLIVMIALGTLSLSSCDTGTDQDHQCTKLASPGGGDMNLCVNFEKHITTDMLPLLLTRPLNVSWIDSTILWLITCSRLVIFTKRDSLKPPTLPTKDPPNVVDILFVIEQSTRMEIDENKKDYLQHSLKSILDLNTRNDEAAHVDVRFGIIAYSVEDSNRTEKRGFVPVSTSQDEDVFFSAWNFDRDGEPSGVLADRTVFRHNSIRRALELIYQVVRSLTGRKLGTNRESSLQPRTNSDLYIISLLDMYPPTQGVAHTSKKIKNSIRGLKKKIEKLVTNMITRFTEVHANSLSLQFVFDETNEVATSILGDPSSSSLYSDCSHFNKAMTLKALLRGSSAQGNSLQAHLLSNGVQARVMTWDDFKLEECVLGLVPSISSYFQLYPTFRNVCHTHSDDPNTGSGDYYCSPIHGWNKKDQRQKQDGDLFEGRAPISTDFSASHAELARLKTKEGENQTSLPLEELTIYEETETLSKNVPKIIGEPTVLQWTPTRPIAEEIIGRKEPLVLHNTVVQSWPAIQKWNMSYLSEHIGLDNLESVKCSNSYLTFDPDKRTPLKLNISIPFIQRNMTRESFFNCVQSSGNPEDFQCSDNFLGHYFFGSVPNALKEDILPGRFLYHTDKDYESDKQFIWISSSGMITHTHFDQDYNFFVQLVGRKRFTLWSPFQHELMYTYPRVHPMWHKSQVNCRDVNTARFPAFKKAKAVQTELGPGDVLYVPPYTWHYVETLSPSVSLSTWSNDYNVYNHMNAIYRHDHKFDLIKDQRGQMFVLRLFLDMMIHDLYGVNETTSFFVKLVQTRFAPLSHLFPPQEDDPLICKAAVSNKIPTCVHVHGYAKLDMIVIGEHFEALEPEVRDILFMDYVEEVTAQVVGIKKMLAFFRYCFLGQDYYITNVGDEEHALWDHTDAQEEET